MSVGMTESLPFTLCADGHAPWIANEVKIGSALFHETLLEDDVAAVVKGLFKCGCVHDDGKCLVYSDETVLKSV